jgi:creatinine amidohydrolase/Fe(II)-dependent formamide hydrolase-like protein
VDPKKLEKAFTHLAEKHVAGEISALPETSDVPAEPEVAAEADEAGNAKAAANAGRKKNPTKDTRKKGQTTLDAVIKKVKKE